jgi:hypothetical protein
MPSQETKKAIEYTLAFATTGAGASFSIKTFVPLPVIDAIPQNLITKVMTDQLASMYGFSELKGLNSFMGMVVGAASGMKLASELATFIPVAGPGSSAVTTFAIHMSEGIVLTIVFELIREGAIPEEYVKNATFGDISILLGLAAETMIEIVRGGDGVESVTHAIEKFKAQHVQAPQI